MTTALILLDATMNALTLILALRLGGERIRIVRVLLGALFGAAAAWAVRALALDRLLGALLWLPIAVMMMRMAADRGTGRQMLKQAVMLGCAMGLAGGMVLALWGATGSLALAYALGGVCAVCIGWGAARTHLAAKTGRAKIAVAYRGRRVEFEAMIDSGNTLRDYLTHLPVIVLPLSAAECALCMEDAPMRPIFAETAGGKQRMSVFSPQEIELKHHGMSRRVRAVIAFSPLMSAGVPALVPSALLEEQGNFNRGG